VDMETLWRITAAVVPVSFGLGLWLMNRSKAALHVVARLCFAVDGTSLGVIGFMWLIHTPTSLPYRIAAGLGIGAFVFVVVPLLIRMAWPPDAQAQNQPPPASQPPIVNQGPGSAFSYGQQGGVTAGTVNIGPIPRRLAPAQADMLSAELAQRNPSGVIEVQTDMMACPDCDSFAKQLEILLRSAPALTVNPVRNGMTITAFKGVALGVRDKNKIPHSAQGILDAFHAMGADLSVIQQSPYDAGTDAVLIIAQPAY
jgi:hypothetical protein